MSNRLVELESTVAHMQATVDGLRDELVDANERIRALEQELEAANEIDDSEPPSTEEAAEVEETESNPSSQPPSQIDDIIVA